MNVVVLLIIFVGIILVSLIFGYNNVFGKPKRCDPHVKGFLPFQGTHVVHNITGCRNCPHMDVSIFDGRTYSPTFSFFDIDCCHPNASKDLHFTCETPGFSLDKFPEECPLVRS